MDGQGEVRFREARQQTVLNHSGARVTGKPEVGMSHKSASGKFVAADRVPPDSCVLETEGTTTLGESTWLVGYLGGPAAQNPFRR